MNLYEQISWDEAGEEMDRLREENEALKAIVADYEETIEAIEADKDNAKRKAYWQIACQLIDYAETCNKYHAVPLMHDVNIFRAKLNAARRKGN